MQNNASGVQKKTRIRISLGLSFPRLLLLLLLLLRSIHLELSAVYLQQARVEIFLVERWAGSLSSHRLLRTLSLNLGWGRNRAG